MELILSKGGYISTKVWRPKKRDYIVKKLSLKHDLQIISYLQYHATIAEGFTLRDYFKMIERYKALELIDSFFPDFLEEVAKAPKKGCNTKDITEITLTKSVHLSYLGDDKGFINEGVDYSGLGTDGQSYAMEFTPLKDYLDVPLVLKDGMFYIESDCRPFSPVRNEKGKIVLIKNEITKVPTSYTLWDIVLGVIWEISFIGTPSNRDDKMEGLKKSIKEIEDGTAKLIPFEEVKERLDTLIANKKK